MSDAGLMRLCGGGPCSAPQVPQKVQGSRRAQAGRQTGRFTGRRAGEEQQPGGRTFAAAEEAVWAVWLHRQLVCPPPVAGEAACLHRCAAHALWDVGHPHLAICRAGHHGAVCRLRHDAGLEHIVVMACSLEK